MTMGAYDQRDDIDNYAPAPNGRASHTKSARATNTSAVLEYETSRPRNSALRLILDNFLPLSTLPPHAFLRLPNYSQRRLRKSRFINKQ
jgi:hypothetical protein